MKKRWLWIVLPIVLVAIAAAWWLWPRAQEPNAFTATVIQLEGNLITVEPLNGQEERTSADRICFDRSKLEYMEVAIGDVVKIFYDGALREGYPASVAAKSWEVATDRRGLLYEGEWLDKDLAVKETEEQVLFDHVRITEAYDDCFFVVPVVPMPFQIKVNGPLTEEWCVGDQVEITYDNAYYDAEQARYEVDLLTIAASDFELEPFVAYKPVIYLYPETPTQVSVSLTLNGRLTCTYPTYEGGWRVTAYPDGTLTDGGQTYNYLYWEGELAASYDFSKGFCIKGEDTAAFLEQALEKLGLTRREANEFIVYWLPLMQENPYNLIAFQTDRYTDNAALNVKPAADTVIRVFMAWKGVDHPIQIQEQFLFSPPRQGFTVVEWGGAQIKD